MEPRSRSISFYKNEIYMVDNSFNCVRVYSYEGKLIRCWGNFGEEPGNFKNPWGIAIYQNIVFIVDSGNYRIQAFTSDGKFIFKHEYDKSMYLLDIIIFNDYAYLNNWEKTLIMRFKVMYS